MFQRSLGNFSLIFLLVLGAACASEAAPTASRLSTVVPAPTDTPNHKPNQTQPATTPKPTEATPLPQATPTAFAPTATPTSIPLRPTNTPTIIPSPAATPVRTLVFPLEAGTSTPLALERTINVNTSSAETVTVTLSKTLTLSPSSELTPAPFVKLLDRVPLTGDTILSQIWLNDYVLVRALYDIPLPGQDADEDALAEFFEVVTTTEVEPSTYLDTASFLAGYKSNYLNRRQYLGFDLRDVEQGILAGNAPHDLEVVLGSFDPQTTELALRACSECPQPDHKQHNAVRYYSWGEDQKIDLLKRYAPPAFDRLGRGGRIAVQDGSVLRSLRDSDMETLIDTDLGQLASLADVEEFRLIADAMTDLGAYSVLISTETQQLDYVDALWRMVTPEEELESLSETLEATPLLRPYEAFGAGIGKDQNGQYMVLALVHANEALAAENAVLLRQLIEKADSLSYHAAWVEMVQVLEIRAEGRVLLAKVSGEIISTWARWIIQVDTLLLHE